MIVSTACKTAGEALREVDIKDVIKSDFVLVSGDVVSNMDLGAALKAHKLRRDKNKNALMTMVPRVCAAALLSLHCEGSRPKKPLRAMLHFSITSLSRAGNPVRPTHYIG